MQLHIAPSKLISEVQKEFADSFPFLKLEFFQSKTAGPGNGINSAVQPSRRIGELHGAVVGDTLDIHPEMKVSDLEKLIKDKFSLDAQVFRRSGKLWLQTTMTDSWTLKKQNEHGLELSRSHNIPLINRGEAETE